MDRLSPARLRWTVYDPAQLRWTPPLCWPGRDPPGPGRKDRHGGRPRELKSQFFSEPGQGFFVVLGLLGQGFDLLAELGHLATKFGYLGL